MKDERLNLNDKVTIDTELINDESLSTRNIMMFSLGTVGRDFTYGLFYNFLLTYILFTKSLNDKQFAAITMIMIAARIFDAFNDPIMGGIVENTRSRWGKFKPWILIGAISTAGVVIATYVNNLQGWNFIIYLGVMYFLFSIAFTMNDISYWGMMPSLSRNEKDRSRLTSASQIFASVGGALAGMIIPIFTAGELAIGGSSVIAFKWIAIFSAILLIGFQLFTVLGVKEKPLLQSAQHEKMGIKKMFQVLFKNDQLMWLCLVLLLFCVGTNVVGGGLSLSYIYFEFGYNGILFTAFGVLFAVAYMIFMLIYPALSKKYGRDKILKVSTLSLVAGYIVMLLGGILLPSDPWILKYVVMIIGNGLAGIGQGFYLIMFISIANTVEYNEWKTGDRDEGLIFSIRPFTAKMGSALMQFIVMLVYLAVGVTAITSGISDIENDAAKKLITEEEKMARINELLNAVPENKKVALLICMCLIPIAFVLVAWWIYKKKCFLNEETHACMVQEIHERNAKTIAMAKEDISEN